MSLLVVAMLGSALAAPARLWTTTAVGGVPDLLGRPQARAEQQVATALDLGSGWTLDGLGSVRDPGGQGAPLTGDLLVAHARGPVGTARLEVGRFARLDPRGALHLDGAAVAWSGPVTVSAWGGRLWHPETWRAGQTGVVGASAEGRLAPGVDAAAGAEGRLAGAGGQARAFSALHVRGARAQALRLTAERALGHQDGARAELCGDLPMRRARLGATARWENLPTDLLPTALANPLTWLAPHGYGVVSVRAQRPAGAALLWTEGGPALHRRLDASSPWAAGGLGRAGASAPVAPHLRLGAHAIAAGLSPTWLAGGVVDAALDLGEGQLRADLGVFRIAPSTGPRATTWEGRLSGRAPVGGSGRVHLRAELAAGVDRLLQPLARGGLALDLRRGPAGQAP